MQKTYQDVSEPQAGLISRETLARRWDVSILTVRRMEERGVLKRVPLADRLVRYSLQQVVEIEKGGR